MRTSILLSLFSLLFFSILTCSVFAKSVNHQLDNSKTFTKPPPHKIKPPPHLTGYQRRPHFVYAVVYSGSLHWNVARIARRFGWNRVVWNLPEDYRWEGKTRIGGHGVIGIFEKLLKSYPVQANFYQGNHVLVITPRTLQ